VTWSTSVSALISHYCRILLETRPRFCHSCPTKYHGLERDSLAVAFLFLGQSLFMENSSHFIMFLFDLNFAFAVPWESRWMALPETCVLANLPGPDSRLTPLASTLPEVYENIGLLTTFRINTYEKTGGGWLWLTAHLMSARILSAASRESLKP